ncbi:MAG: protein translocase subunit SecF [Bdellovibrionota bacterium]
MIQLIRPNGNFDFLGKSKPFIVASTLAAILSTIGLFTKGLNFGIDFTGGAEVQLKAPQGWNIGKVRSELESGGLKDPVVVQIGATTDREFLIKVQSSPEKLAAVGSDVKRIIGEKSGSKDFEVVRVDVVGPQAGANLRSAAILSIFYAALAILIYITFRFDVRYAPGVVRALGVDVIITLGIWVLLQKEFNLTVLASLLTIAGYSCNDTIVIYDRIRDYTKTYPSWGIEQAVNRSINQNLGRTLLTTICTLFVVVTLWIMGGPVLQDFALPLLIGMVISVFSTIFVANPMVVYMEKRRLARAKATPAHAK